MAERTAVVCEIITFFIQGYCLQYFFGSFLESRISDKRKNILAVSAGYCTFKTALAHLVSSDLQNAGSFYRLILYCLLFPAFIFCFYRAAKTITVFLFTTFLALGEISFFIGYMVMSLSTLVLEVETDLFTRGYIDAAYFEQILRFTAALLQIFCCALWVLILFFSLKKVVCDFREKEYEMRRTELLFILTPGLMGFLLCVLLRIIMVTVENGMPALLYDRYPALRVLIPAILLLALLSILYSVKLFQDMILRGREQNNRIILEQQISSMQEHVGEIERLYAGVRSLKHDMKNTLAVLMRLASAGDGAGNPELADYLAELNQSFDKLEFRFRTGNAVADALLNMKYHEIKRCFAKGGSSEKKNPEWFDFDADDLLFPEELAIQSYDIGVILGNALDNAIEACRRLVQEHPQAEPFIRLSSFQRGRFFFLEIENSFDGMLKKSSQSEFPATLKEDKQMHGVGFANIKKTAEKYDGGVDYSVEDRLGSLGDGAAFPVFTLSVMLKNSGRTADSNTVGAGRKMRSEEEVQVNFEAARKEECRWS